MSAMASQITGVSIVYTTLFSGPDQRKHHSSASLAFLRWILEWPVDSPHKGPVTRKMFPFDDAIVSTDALFYLLIKYPFYSDVDEIFWPQPIRSFKLGHVTGQGSMSPTWVGRVSDPGTNNFHKKCKNLDNIAVYLITSLKSKWKINKWKIWIAGYDNCFFFYQFFHLQWNSLICKMIDYLKSFIVKFNLNFENALENKCESI